MGCGCNESGPDVPLTSGDIAVEGTGRFVVRLDGNTVPFDTYAEASSYKREHGGHVDVAR